jgi:NAD(P)-dependent dehydrogenase (short-subunit alcohol dehydrogenase family)
VDICRQVPTVPYPMAMLADLAETAKQVEALDRRVVAAEVDVRDLAGLTAAVSDGVALLGRLDIVLADAGISTPAPTLEMDELVWNETIEINLTGQWKTIRAAVPHIIAGGGAERW